MTVFLGLRSSKSVVLACILLALATNTEAKKCQLSKGDDPEKKTLVCEYLKDGDLPDESHGNLLIKSIIVSNTSLTHLPSSSFGEVSTYNIQILNNPLLEKIEENFLGSFPLQTKEMNITANVKLSKFPWSYIENFPSLSHFTMDHSAVSVIPGNIPWSSQPLQISFGYNTKLKLVSENAFLKATKLTSLKMLSSSPNIVFETNSLRTTSSNLPSFELYFSGKYNGVVNFKQDAFGNVHGGELWGSITSQLYDFPKNVFRHMLKTHMNKGSESLFHTDLGVVSVKSCDDCDIAWFYKDAHLFNVEYYKKLVSDGNVVCKDIGPVLETEDSAFINQMNECPYTQIVWPGGDACASAPTNTSVAVDKDECHCFFLCSHGDVHGHECCQPGLAFNPELGVCDWEDNVSGCKAL